ncbi:kyphoscoliosis peptidase [Anolis carolinensis]|uniref:kyphoscoliosis peptidase n=1 Tax=Anolis carolinensis TaxID=28377 RepID=UPI002F2B3123
MAFHDSLSRTQKILLSIFCFPVLPFYLCYVYFTKSEEDEGTSNSAAAQAEEGRIQEAADRQSRFTGQAVETQYDAQPPIVTFQPNQDRVSIEILPRYPTPHTRKKSSIRKVFLSVVFLENQVFPDQIGKVNKGFQDDGEQRPTLSGRQDHYAYPWDKSNLKSMSIDIEQFKSLDVYASKVNVRNSVENLVNVLLQRAHSDLEKVRAIWIWVCHHIEYDVEGFHNEAKRSCAPADVLRSGKSVCAGYAALFEQMCSIAGIQCKQVSGFSKGYSYRPGKVFNGESDHAWNSVHLDGRWHLLDSTWGSGTVDDSCANFTFRYNEFYFLTHPALFINDHFPEDQKWQLLKQPLTLQQFEKNAHFRPKFYTTGLVESSAKTIAIETENGKATIFIESRVPVLFLVSLNGAKEHCLMMLQKNGVLLEVYPPQTGTHRLEIFAKANKDTEKEYSSVLEYSLKCRSVDRSISLPRALIQPVGPSWHSEENGILEALPDCPIIRSDDGRCVVTFTRKKNLDVFATLDSDSSTVPEDIRRRHIWKTCQGSQVELKINLPHSGDFALHIWAKKASDPGSHQCALSYLLSCPNKSVMWPVFPLTYRNWEENYELVSPLAGILPANRQVQFKLKMPGVDEASVQCGKTYPLTHRGDDFWEGDCHTSGSSKVRVMVSQNANDNTFWSVLEYKVESH